MRSQPALEPLLLGWLHVLSTGGVGSPAEHCPLSLGRVHLASSMFTWLRAPKSVLTPVYIAGREGGRRADGGGQARVCGCLSIWVPGMEWGHLERISAAS